MSLNSGEKPSDVESRYGSVISGCNLLLILHPSEGLTCIVLLLPLMLMDWGSKRLWVRFQRLGSRFVDKTPSEAGDKS